MTLSVHNYASHFIILVRPLLIVPFADIDECTTNRNNCTKNEYCKNTQGSFKCSCPKNYKGDGIGKDGCKFFPKEHSMRIAFIFIGNTMFLDS